MNKTVTHSWLKDKCDVNSQVQIEIDWGSYVSRLKMYTRDFLVYSSYCVNHELEHGIIEVSNQKKNRQIYPNSDKLI